MAPGKTLWITRPGKDRNPESFMDAATDFPAGSVMRPSVLADYARVRGFSEILTEPLSAEDMTVQSMADASPTKWHLAHTSWFFETFILKSLNPAYRPFDAAYEYLFNSYYNGIGAQFHRPSRGVLSRPTVDEIFSYRAHVDEAMRIFIATAPETTLRSARPLIELGLNHEQQHQELIVTDLKHAMSFNPLYPAIYAPQVAETSEAAELTWIAFDGGIRDIGWRGNGFAFDNEGPVHDVLLRPFRLASRPVTNGEFAAFIADGGYTSPRLWLSDGWSTVQREGWDKPIYWTERDGAWHEYTLGGLKPVDLAAPASHISFYEANAYAEWAGARLPSEFEWEVASHDATPDGHFAAAGLFQPRAATRGPGLRQMFGDVWEWTQSSYAPYPGFKADADVVGEYNGKFMVNQLVLRGGSCATPAGHIRASYRNFFYPHHRWQFSGLRLAEDA
jgi:ergothioneine biosynthesis protein EgtB